MKFSAIAIGLYFYCFAASAVEMQDDKYPAEKPYTIEKCDLSFSEAYWKLSLVGPTLGSFLGYEVAVSDSSIRRYRFLFVTDKLGLKFYSSVLMAVDEQARVLSIDKPVIFIDRLNTNKVGGFFVTLQNELEVEFKTQIEKEPYRFEVLKGCKK